MDETRLERALRQGPPLPATAAPRPLQLEDTMLRVPRSAAARLAFIVAVTGLLLLAALAGLAAAGFFDTSGGPPYSVVIERSNRLHGDAFRVTHDAYAPGADRPEAVTGSLPTNAVSLEWSPDRRWLTYQEVDVPAGRHGATITGFFLAGTDGGHPVRVATPRDPGEYGAPGNTLYGVAWAPSNTMFAFAWTTGTCVGPSSCLPPSGIDIFDTTGGFVSTVQTPGVISLIPVWSPDSSQVGWTSGTCVDNICRADAFHEQSVRDAAPAVTIPLAPTASGVRWSAAGRLFVGAGIRDDGTGGSAYSMLPDGTDRQPVTWSQASAASWSPDGRWLGLFEATAGKLTVRNVETGKETTAFVPGVDYIASWSPDGERLVLEGEGTPYTDPDTGRLVGTSVYSVINVDGTGLVSLGEGWDVSWRPTRGGRPG